MPRALIEEGRDQLLLGGLIETGCPVRTLQGVQDPDVPWRHAVELSSRLAHDDVVLTLVKDGDHRLSRPEDLERLIARSEERRVGKEGRCRLCEDHRRKQRGITDSIGRNRYNVIGGSIM